MNVMQHGPTYEIAMAAARDEANRRMTAEGRRVWSQEDYALAARTFQRIVSIAEDKIEQDAMQVYDEPY